MKNTFALPLTAVLGGAAAFILRLAQNATGFEDATGLPIPGNPAGMALIALLLILALLFILMTRMLPRESGETPSFPAGFAVDDPRLLALPVAGLFLMAASGVLDLAMGTGLLGSFVISADPSGETTVALLATGGFSARTHLLLGVLTLFSAAGLFPCLLSCRRGRPQAPGGSPALLIPPAALVVRLVMTYRADSINPSLETYYVDLLALVFLTLGFYRLSSFAFGAGRTSRLALYAALGVVLSAAALADGPAQPSSALLYAGGALTLLGFLLMRLAAFAPAPEG